jgi:hypothetical protein
MAGKSGDEEGTAGTIGVRSRFDWFFIAAVIPGVYLVGLKLAQIDTKLDNRVTRTELTRWTVEFAARNEGKAIVVPVFLPPQQSNTDGGEK